MPSRRQRQPDVAWCGRKAPGLKAPEGETWPHWESTKPSEKEDWVSSALGVDRIHKPKVHKPARWGGGKSASSQETGVTVAGASIGAVEEFPEGKPYRVGKVPNAAKNRRREQETPSHHGSTEQQNTTVHVPTNPTGIPHRVRL